MRAVLLCVWMVGTCAWGQVLRVGLKPQLTVGDSLTVGCTPSAVSFALVHGAAASGSASVAVTTSWSGVSLLAGLNVYASFSSSTQALSGGSPVAYIASGQVFGQVTTGLPTNYTAFAQTGPFGAAGASLELFSSGALVSLGGSRTDNLSLKIDLTGYPQQPAGTYSGTLYVQAQAF